MDGLSATRAIGALVARGARPYAPIVVRACCAALPRARPSAAEAQEALDEAVRALGGGYWNSERWSHDLPRRTSSMDGRRASGDAAPPNG